MVKRLKYDYIHQIHTLREKQAVGVTTAQADIRFLWQLGKRRPTTISFWDRDRIDTIGRFWPPKVITGKTVARACKALIRKGKWKFGRIAGFCYRLCRGCLGGYLK
ncbi:hypothetical protein Gura_4342 [Geotalea uraniireducens Rf4]|uniref:Uncharacterized protein n=1 Tax=Geotalea uraniireducens (strain Rf4) TaxID=351605 RepID=A5G9L7_GEOUR|nr:hypothetical protein Gura_4342 [Geotalea uraniireducens Rf4]